MTSEVIAVGLSVLFFIVVSCFVLAVMLPLAAGLMDWMDSVLGYPLLSCKEIAENCTCSPNM